MKNHIKENKAKANREKTVITGDMKPMIDSLFTSTIALKTKNVADITKANLDVTNKQSKKDVAFDLLNKKEIRDKNIERENSKPILKQSIRNKKQ